jgi:uncharacterized protein (DUF58 family)
MTGRARGLAMLFAACLVAGVISGRPVFFNLSYVCLGVLLVSFLWSRTALRGVSVTRRPGSTRSQVGHTFEEAITLVNRSRIPKLWVELRDESELPNHRASAVMVGVGGGRERSQLVRTHCTVRGRFRLGPARLHTGDPFGLFLVSRPVPQIHQLVVLPLVTPLPSFPLPSGRLPGGVAVTEPTQQITPNAAGVREYLPGDGFNRIHWVSTARRGRLIVKEFELDPLGDAWVVLDTSRGMQWELPGEERSARESPFLPRRISLPPASIEYGVACAASLVQHFLRQDRSVGFLAYDRVRHSIQPDRGAPQLIRALETLAVIDGAGETAIEDVLRIEDTHLTRGAMILVITASTSPGLVPALRALRMQSLTPVLVLLASGSFGAPADNALHALDAGRAGIPVRLVRCGDSLEIALSRPATPAALRPAA